MDNIETNNTPLKIQNNGNAGNAGSIGKVENNNLKQPILGQKSTTIIDEELEKPYTDKRSVTISLVKNYSAYRKANLKVMGLRHEVIGSSVTSCRKLSANQGEVEAYFPQLIGLSPNNPDFTSRVKAYLSNIQMNINNDDAVLNTSFIYNHKKDYIAISRAEDAINDAFDKIDRSNTAVIKEALKKKIEDLNTLESSKYKYGRPENLEDYLMYRHCLLYRDVAKDIALINEDPSIRFYIKDEKKEAIRQKKLVEEKKRALKLFNELCGTESKFNAVFMQVAILKGQILSEAMLSQRYEKESVLINFVNESPDKFNKIVSDKSVIVRGLIETLIMRGELVRSEYNQQISTADGSFIGANMNEAIEWFNNPNNAGTVEMFKTKANII